MSFVNPKEERLNAVRRRFSIIDAVNEEPVIEIRKRSRVVRRPRRRSGAELGGQAGGLDLALAAGMTGMTDSSAEGLVEVDRRLLPLRADRLACQLLLDGSRQAIERLESYAEVVSGNSRVPVLALARLRSIHREWESAAEDLQRLMDAEMDELQARHESVPSGASRADA